MLPRERKTAKQIRDTFSGEITFMSQLHEVVVGMLSTGQWSVPARGLDSLVVETTFGLMIKSAKTFRALHVLLERGFRDDALTLLRVQYETLILVAFILQKKSRQRVRQYHAYRTKQELKMLEHWRRTPGLKRKVGKSDLEKARLIAEEWQNELPPGIDIRRHWSGLASFEQAVAAVRHDRGYAVLYRLTSKSAHATDYRSHVASVSSPGELQYLLSPTAKDLRVIASSASALMWLLASLVNARMVLGFDEALSVYAPTKGGDSLEASE